MSRQSGESDLGYSASFPWLIWITGPVTLGIGIASIELGLSKLGFAPFFLLMAFGHAVAAAAFVLRFVEARWHLSDPALWLLVFYWIGFATLVATWAPHEPGTIGSGWCALGGVALSACLLLIPGMPVFGGVRWICGRRRAKRRHLESFF